MLEQLHRRAYHTAFKSRASGVFPGTGDFIPKDAEDGTPGKTEYVVGEFNCSCVGISKFQAVCGGEKTLADVPDEDFFEASELTDLMGTQAIKMLDEFRK